MSTVQNKAKNTLLIALTLSLSPNQVTFMVEQTGEYMFYNVTFKSTPSGIMDTIELSTQVRRSISHDIVITNPLNSNVTFSASTTIPEISLPSNFVVGPDSKV